MGNEATGRTDFEIAVERLTHWVREYGDQKPREFIGDVSLILLAAKDCDLAHSETATLREENAQLRERVAELESRSFFDSTPIDESWLKETGWKLHEGNGSWIFEIPTGNRLSLNLADGSLFCGGCLMNSVTTRGQLTRLLFALGVFDEN